MVRIATQAPSPTLSVNVDRRPGVVLIEVQGDLDPRVFHAEGQKALDA